MTCFEVYHYMLTLTLTNCCQDAKEESFKMTNHYIADWQCHRLGKQHYLPFPDHQPSASLEGSGLLSWRLLLGVGHSWAIGRFPK